MYYVYNDLYKEMSEGKGMKPMGASQYAIRILIVDDSAANRRLVRSMLRVNEYVFIEAKDGEHAIIQLNEHTISLVVSDVDMPRMDGITLCQRIRADEKLHHIPIVILTAHYDNQTRYEALNAGVNVYLTKPVAKQQLVQQVKQLLQVSV